MIKKTLLTLLLLVAITGSIAGVKYLQVQKIGAVFAGMPPPSLSVATAPISEVEWAVQSKAIGTITPVQGVVLSVDSPGIITTIHFESGQHVKKGDLLLTLDTESEAAELEAAEAAAELAKINLDRAERLIANQTIAQSEYDTRSAQFKQATAEVKNLQSRIARKKITAPFDGVLGIRRVNLGQFISSETDVVSLQSEDPVYVSFFLPQQDVSFLEKDLAVGATSNAFPGKTFTGKVNAVDSQIDIATRRIEVQAVLGNPDGALKPGMFVNVLLQQAEPRKALAIEATSVVYASYGNTIFTVVPAREGEGFVAKQNFVTLGERLGDYVEIVDGLLLGDRAVISGGFKLYPFASVIVNDDRAPPASMYPNPEDN